jgi:hypothetical protein
MTDYELWLRINPRQYVDIEAFTNYFFSITLGMSWVEAKHRSSEERAELLQSKEIAKIQAARASLYEIVSRISYDKDGVSNEQFELSYSYLSDDTDCSDYGTDTYKLAKETKLYGRIMRLDTISPIMLQKHDLYSHLANVPASHRFPKAISYSALIKEMLGISSNYEYKSCIISHLSSVTVTFKHKALSCFASEYKDIMHDGLQSTITRDFGIISEKDFTDIRILFLIIPSPTSNLARL